MFSSIGNINSYVKNLMMQKKIDAKNNRNSKNNSPSIFKIHTSDNPVNSMTLQIISGKLRRGEEISPSELGYLSKNAPELYAQAVKVIKERKEFSEKLKNCRTEEEVRSLKSVHSISITMSAKSQGSSADTDLLAMRIAAANNVYNKFVSSEKFKKIVENDRKASENKAEVTNKDVVEISSQAQNISKKTKPKDVEAASSDIKNKKKKTKED